MPETTEQYHRIPLSSGHEGHRIRTITISAEQGIKALYCGTCKEIVTYLFETGKWTMAKAKQWVKEHKSERRLEMDAIRGERSLDRITELVKRAWWEQIERPINERGDPRESTPYVINVFTDRVIIGLGADYYEVAYELADDGAVTFAQRDAWKKAELEWTALERAVARLGRVAEAFGDLMANLTGQGDGLRLAKVGDYQIATVHTDFGLAPGDTAWEWDAAAQNAIVDKGGWAMYKAAHLVTDTTDGDMPEKKSAYTYPVAQLIGGDMQYVFRAAATVYGGLKGGARAASLPQGVKEAALKTVIGIYKRFGRDTSEMSLSADQVIERFTAALAQRPYLLRTEETGAAPITNEQGWVKKVILRTGEWKEPAPGQTQPLAISLEHLLTIKAGFDEGAYERVSVPIGHGKLFDDMQHATENNAGFVRALEVEPGENGDYRLSAWIEFTDSEVRKKVVEGSIWNCSVMVVPNVTRPDDGRVFPLALKHLALTNYPWVSGLGGFVEELAAEQATVFTLGGMQMGTQATDNRILELEKAGLTVEQAIALAGRQQAITQREQELARREAELAVQARQTEIRAIVLALEGKETREGVTAIAGTRHYPVVITAVQAALERIPADGMTLRLARDGKTEEVRVDALILAVANAIPKEGRLRLEAVGVLPHRETGGQRPTDEQIVQLATELGL